MELMLNDSMKISQREGNKEIFSAIDMHNSIKNSVRVAHGQILELKKSQVEVYSAGHAPGASSFLLNANKKVLYTGDFSTGNMKLVKGADTEYDPDILITECTYSQRDHKSRESQEKKLIEIVKDTINNGGVALIPSFAISRSQEMLLILKDLDVPIYLDGMCREVTDIIMKYPECVKNYNDMKYAVSKCNYMTSKRKKVLRDPCVIIGTAGMLTGGAMVKYIKRLYDKENCSITLVGFQMPETPGHTLLKNNRFVFENLDLKVKMKINFLDFSAHIDRSHLLKYFKKVNPEKIYLMHGEDCENFGQELRELGWDTVVPKNGDVFEE